jgi:hypothetical protein
MRDPWQNAIVINLFGARQFLINLSASDYLLAQKAHRLQPLAAQARPKVRAPPINLNV